MLTVRASSVPTYLDCQRKSATDQFPDLIKEAGFELREKKTGVHAPVGSGVHKSCEFMLTEKIVTGELPNEDDCIDAGIQEFYKKSKELGDDIEYDTMIYSQGVAEKHIQRLTMAYYTDVAPRLIFPEGCDPKKHLELELKAIVEGFELSGHIDVLTSMSLLDTKTGKALRSYHTQHGAYGNLLKANGIEIPKIFMVTFLPKTSLDKVYPGTKFKKYDPDFCINEAWIIINQIIRDVKNFIKDGNPAYFQANPQSYMCSAQYCKAYGTEFCKYFK